MALNLVHGSGLWNSGSGGLFGGPGGATHRATTAHVQVLYPFQTSPGLGTQGTYIGQEQHGGPFCYDPWQLYPHHLTNPNILIAGQIGRGKSALIKTLLRRGLVFGHRAAVLDPKGEYGPLARSLGVEPIRLAPGLGIRLNPLDPGPGAAVLGADEIQRRQLALLQSITAAALRRELQPVERAACKLALAAVTYNGQIPTIPDIARALFAPSDTDAAQIHMTAHDLARSAHDVALELQRLCDGDLAGMFDGPSTINLDWDGPIVVIDLSGLPDDDSLAILMACATAWIHNAVARPDAGRRYIVVDEAWTLFRHLPTARWLRASLKLARQYGVANIVALHRFSDLQSAGDASSEHVALAKGLVSDTETRIVYAQPIGEIRQTADILGLTRSEQHRLPTLPPGKAIWKVGATSHTVQHLITEQERAIIDTDTRIGIGLERGDVDAP